MTQPLLPLRRKSALEPRELARVPEHAAHIIDGGHTASSDRTTFEVRDPGDGTLLAHVARGGPHEITAAVAAARRAVDGQPRAQAELRRMVARFVHALAGRRRELAILAALERGTPVRAISDDLDAALESATALAARAAIDGERAGFRARRAGVVGLVASARLPLRRTIELIIDALGAGDAVIALAPRAAPLAILRLAEIANDAAVGAGSLGAVAGDAAAAAALAAHRDLDDLALFGPAADLRPLAVAAAAHRANVHAAFDVPPASIVFADAPFDGAAEALALGLGDGGAYAFIEERAAGDIEERLRARVAQVRVRPALDPACEVGPLADADSLARAQAQLDALRSDGARIERAPAALPHGGFWFSPAVAFDCAQHRGAAEVPLEAPVLAATTFRTPDEALALARLRGAPTLAVWTASAALGDYCATRASAVHVGICAPVREGSRSATLGRRPV